MKIFIYLSKFNLKILIDGKHTLGLVITIMYIYYYNKLIYFFNVKNSFYGTITISDLPRILHAFDFAIVYFQIDKVYQPTIGNNM